MQSARKVQSEEARGQLRDAHQRVMSIAAVQRLLGVSQLVHQGARNDHGEQGRAFVELRVILPVRGRPGRKGLRSPTRTAGCTARSTSC